MTLGHVPIIEPHPRSVPGGKEAMAAEALARRTAGYQAAEDVRYNARSGAERINGGLKDDFGARYVRVRGHRKVFCHLNDALGLDLGRIIGAAWLSCNEAEPHRPLA